MNNDGDDDEAGGRHITYKVSTLKKLNIILGNAAIKRNSIVKLHVNGNHWCGGGGGRRMKNRLLFQN